MKTREALLLRLAAQREEIENKGAFGAITENIGESLWGVAPKKPIAEHPRLLLTKDKLSRLKALMTLRHPVIERFLELSDTELEGEGVLPEVTHHGINATVLVANIHNFEVLPLEIILAKALRYLASNDAAYGYGAILYLKNYLLTLDIRQIASDQCRQYGQLMFVSALVYDWCYDLLTDLDKTQIIAGVEHRICRMRNDMTPREGQVVLEVGFPPAGQGAVVGHGSEGQILRNYLAFAAAIYGENNSWWDYIAARVYNDYVPPRNYYYKTGVACQGPYYGMVRTLADLFSAWLLQTATGENPYVGMENIIRGFLSYEYADGMLFSDGDGHAGDGSEDTIFTHHAYLSAYLFADADMLAYAEHLREKCGTLFEGSLAGLNVATFVALLSTCDLSPSDNRYAGMELITYNPAPLSQYIVKNKRTSDSAAVFLRGKERTTGNHEHADTASFEIYYKGMLTNKGGIYKNYGHAQTMFYYRSSISKNTLILFSPDKCDPESDVRETKWYSGSQRRPGEPATLQILLDPVYDMSKTLGHAHAYKDSGTPDYAYIASDLTLAYPADDASYVERRMLTVYTDDPDFPMVLFVCDDVEASSPRIEKRFLLQITSPDAPKIDTERGEITTEKDEGRLVLRSFSKGVSFRTVGGRNEGDYASSKSMNYAIEGRQCAAMTESSDDGHFGRVEIVASKRSSAVAFLNLLYVTDRGQEKDAPASTRLDGKGCVGMTFGEITALFATARGGAIDPIEIALSAPCRLFVSGLAEGNWQAMLDGEPIASADLSRDSAILTLSLPRPGVLTLTRSV